MSETKCIICKTAVGAARVTFDCQHAMHLLCATPLFREGALRCVACVKHGPCVVTGITTAQTELVLHQLRANRAKEVSIGAESISREQ